MGKPNPHLEFLLHRVSEAEENNTTQLKIGNFGKPQYKARDPYAEADKRADREKLNNEGLFPDNEMARDRNRDSMFGTMLISNTISKEYGPNFEARLLQMQDPHHIMY